MIKLRSLGILLLMTVVALIFSSCLDLKPVELKEVKSVHVSSIENNELKLVLELVIANPNSQKFSVRDADLNISMGDVLLGKLHEVDPFTIPAHSSKSYKVPITVDLKHLEKNAKQLSKSIFKGGNSIRIKGYIKARSFMISKKIEIDEQTKLNLMKSIFG